MIKLIPLLVPIVIYILVRILRSSFLSIFFSNNQNQSKEMIVCSSCGTYVHQDLVFRNYGKNFCSKNCSKP